MKRASLISFHSMTEPCSPQALRDLRCLTAMKYMVIYFLE